MCPSTEWGGLEAGQFPLNQGQIHLVSADFRKCQQGRRLAARVTVPKSGCVGPLPVALISKSSLVMLRRDRYEIKPLPEKMKPL